MIAKKIFTLPVFIGLILIPASRPAWGQTKTDANAGKGPSSVSLTLSRNPPADYEKRLKPLMTSLKDVLAKRGDYDAQGKDGIILLDETVMYSDATGRRLWATHMIEESVNESGAQTLGEFTREFRTEDQHIHLMTADSILPDGRKISVEDRAVIMESAQSDAGDSLYGDRGQMRIIFSAMKPGVVREVIIVMEEKTARIAGHFSTLETWGAYWPVRHSRLVLAMPESLESKLRETRLGAGMPPVVKAALPDGTRTWVYEKERLPPDYAEGGRPPQDQSGPALFFTTLPNWETFGDWYRKLLKERSTLPEPLLALAREWTKEAKSDADKIKAILTHVARDVRYTGLEFGLGAMQPRPPGQVWETAYGDCKDKSNLSALLLRSVGIEAHLVLIQTEHLGRIEKRSPDTRHFNHAIVAVKSPEGWQFSDPTIHHITPGVLAPSSCDRDVLIVKPEGIEWARTPASPGGTVHYHLDADFAVDGSIEGWLEQSSSDYYLASDRSYFERMGQDELKRDLQQTLGSLMPGARLIDAEKGKPDAKVVWRAFFTLPTRASGNDERLPLVFPSGGPVMLSMGDDEKRQTTRFLWPVTWRVSGSIRLPEGWVPADTPAPFDLQTDAYEVAARWEVKDGVCLPHYEARVTRNVMPPSVHATAWRGTQTLSGWLQKPLWLQRGEAPTATTPAVPQIALGKFPLMPTGEGQLAFVEERYPSEGNRELRRAALRKVLEHFPNDPVTAFTARIRLALVDWDENKNAEAEKALREINLKPPAKVDEESVAWGRYMHALVLGDLEKYAEAVTMLEALARRPSLSEYRRAWSFLQLSYMHEKQKDLARALADAREGLALQNPDATNGLIAEIAFLLIEMKQENELPAELKKLVETQAAKAAPQLLHLAKLADAWAKNGKPHHAETTLKSLEDLAFNSPEPAYAEFMTRARTALAQKAVAGDLQKELQQHFKAHPDTLKTPPEGWPADQKACAAAFAAADEKGNSDTGHRLALRLMTEYPPNADFSRLLWRATAHLEHFERGPETKTASPLLSLLLKLGRKLPIKDDFYWEMRFVEGTVFEHRGQNWTAAAAHYAAMNADEAMPEAFRSSILTREADCYEKLSQWPKAAETLSKLERWKTYTSAGDGLARAAHLRLELGDAREALRLLHIVETSRDFHLKHTVMAETLTELLDLAKDEKRALEVWQAKPKWWADWQALRTEAGIQESQIEAMVTDAESLGTDLNQALESKDTSKVGQIFQRLVHQARWAPGFTNTVSWASLYRMSAVHPKLKPSFLKFILVILRDTQMQSEDHRRTRLMYLAMCGIDTNQSPQALVDVHEYFKAFPKDSHAISFVMSRLWALIARENDKEQPAVIVKLQEHLTSPELRAERMRSVEMLIEMLRAQKRVNEIKTVLEAELKSPAFATDDKALAQIKQLMRSEGENEAFGDAIRQWLDKHGPPWFAFAEPKTLAAAKLDPDDHDLEKAVENRPFQEQLKIYLLAAAERQAPIEQRLDWWRQGLNGCLRIERGQRSVFHTRIQAILDAPGAPTSLKDATLRIAGLFCVNFGTKADYQKLRNKLDEKEWNEDTRAYLGCVDRVFAADLNSSASITQTLREQVKENSASVLIELLASNLAGRALHEGKVEPAQTVADALSELRKSGGIPVKDLQSIRLGIVKRLGEVKRLLPLHAALERAVAEHAGSALPKVAAPDVIGDPQPNSLSSAAYIAWMLAAIQQGTYDRQDLQAWFSFGQACAEIGSTSTVKLRQAMSQAVFDAAAVSTDDQTRRDAAEIAISFIDNDSAEERKFVFALLKTWRDPKLPETYAEIRSEEAHIALRTGESFDFKAIQDQLKDAGMDGFLHDLALSRAISSGDVPAIKRALDDIDSDALLDHQRLPRIIPALKKAGRTDELTLAMEEAPLALYEALLESWSGNDLYAARRALHLTEILEKPQALPAEWIAFCDKAYPERQDQLVMRMKISRIKKDWPAMLEAATEVVEKYPTFYSHYWPKAEALIKLNRPAEALEPLRTFVKLCHDEPDHLEASSLLKQIESAKP